MATLRTHFRKMAPLWIVMACWLYSCGESTVEEATAPVVSKRIAIAPIPKPVDSAEAVPVEAAAPTAQPGQTDASTATGPIYDPKVRLNPFIPLFKEEKQTELALATPDKSSRKKREPRTPLELLSLDQLNLVAIVRADSGNSALVEDNSGKGYIIKKGTYIGLNSGVVTEIHASGIIVEEELENLMGELILQNTEIKLQKPAGE